VLNSKHTHQIEWHSALRAFARSRTLQYLKKFQEVSSTVILLGKLCSELEF